MTTRKIEIAMALAAGYGTRMRPITDTIPKPLVPVAGRTLLDRTLDRFEDAGIRQVVVNTHYLGQQIVDHLQERPKPQPVFSPEDPLLETGGGVVNALPLLGEEAFFVANSDTLWIDRETRAMDILRETWNSETMDALLLLHPTETAVGYAGTGDFHIEDDGRVRRRIQGEPAPYVFTGVQILHPRVLAGEEVRPFSLNVTYDKAIEAGRLYAVANPGEWYHVGTPASIPLVEGLLAERGDPAASRQG